jgi:hypothetical protein
MHFLITMRKFFRPASVVRLLAVSLFCVSSIASGQSTDIALPSAVSTNELIGSIAARDIGDPRLTDHYYAFIGTPGDLLITIDSRNINGDVDVFTASGLRPLLKLTVYADNTSPVTKSIYLRKRENLILRIEGRTPNDDAGTYRLYFGGGFEPITGGPLLAEHESAATEPTIPGGRTGKKGRRVSSVGARIAEPPSAEVAAAPTPEATPVESPEPKESRTEAAKAEAGSEVTKTAVIKPPARTARGRRPPGRRTRTPLPPKAEETSKSETENTSPKENTEAAPKPTSRSGRSTRRSTTARAEAKAPAPVEPVPESGPRLIIETDDGTMINRYMSGVRRVVVENGQVVVTGKDGKVEKIRLVSVVRMSISP